MCATRQRKGQAGRSRRPAEPTRAGGSPRRPRPTGRTRPLLYRSCCESRVVGAPRRTAGRVAGEAGLSQASQRAGGVVGASVPERGVLAAAQRKAHPQVERSFSAPTYAPGAADWNLEFPSCSVSAVGAPRFAAMHVFARRAYRARLSFALMLVFCASGAGIPPAVLRERAEALRIFTRSGRTPLHCVRIDLP